MSEANADERRARVRDRYADIVRDGSSSCCGPAQTEGTDCCSTNDARAAKIERLYADETLEPSAALGNLGLGCGNPKALAALEPGETVLDLGSGAGFDCFLAAEAVGSEGRVIGVDMTPEMVERARETARSNGFETVSFRLGEIEHLPVGDETIDVVISNCVINLSPEKPRVFGEAFRVLRPGGRLAVSDVVRTAPLPAGVRDDPELEARCIAGAEPIPTLESMIRDAGFVDVGIEPKDDSASFIREWDDRLDFSEYLVSASITATKPV